MSAESHPLSGRVALICFDGSDDAHAAIVAAAPLIAGHDVIVACFWRPFADFARAYAVSLLEIVQDAKTINEREEALAVATAAAGAEFARANGVASPETRAPQVSGPIDEAIIAFADEIDAQLIVLGSRGRSSVGSALLGDVAHDVVQRARRPVLVVPSSALAERRR
jgi:nucleotide-binding universal stress UspA family protein